MSIFSALENLFKAPDTAAASAAANPAVPSATTPQSDGSMAAIPAAGAGNTSPLAEYGKLWEPETSPKAPTRDAVQLAVNPASLQEAAKGVDFSKAINPADLEKAGRGDTAALASIINAASQAGFAHSAALTSNIVQQALTEQMAKVRGELIPEILRSHDASKALNVALPIAENPAVAPLFNTVRQQVASKFPQASPAEIQKHTTDIFNGLAESIITASGGTVVKSGATGQPGSRAVAASSPAADWTNFFAS